MCATNRVYSQKRLSGNVKHVRNYHAYKHPSPHDTDT